MGGHEWVGGWKSAQDRLKEKVIPLTKGARLQRSRTIGRGQTLAVGARGVGVCLVIWGGACMEIEGKGKEAELEWEGRAPALVS